MTALSLPPIDIMQRAAAELARESAGNTSRIGAINKAAYFLSIRNVEVVPAFDGFLVASATRQGTVHRVSTVDGCSCESGQRARPCWHAAIINILETAGRFTMPALPSRPSYEKALAEMNELYGEV